MVNHTAPDYYLFLADIAEIEGNEELKDKNIDRFIEFASTKSYGSMYNTSLIEILAESKPEEAVKLAEMEVDNRATPETYALLAYALGRKGEKAKAYEMIDIHVNNRTSEPRALYFVSWIYKANGMTKKLKELKNELEHAAFELGPVLVSKIAEL
jgi:hypothetical protein